MASKNGLPLLVLALALSGCELAESAPESSTIGLVNATELDVASKVPGRLASVAVKEGQFVSAGELLAELDCAELDAKAAQADAAIDAARAKLALAKKGARPESKRAAKSAVEAAQHQVDVTRKMYDRIAKLFEAEVVPPARFDEVEFRYNTSVDQLAIARANYDAVVDGARDEEIDALDALVAQAEAALEEVHAYQAETLQRAPLSAMVSKVYLHTGELATTGSPILTLVDLDDVWVSFALREDKLRELKVGDRAEVEIPALGRSAEMRVDSLAVMGDFATWRASSDRDRYDLKTFEVRLRPVQPIDGLRPGMSVRWSI